MTTSSRAAALFGVNDWKSIYRTFSQADFTSYDYEALRKSFIDYLRTYYPESFNDYTESSEFIALLDLMAFMGQGLSFRGDLNTRESFIDTAERRDSVVKLAKLVSYTPKRNLAGQGYLKVTSVRTTELLSDIAGNNIGNTTILWNDPANNLWLEQFNTVINAALTSSQRIGRPGNSQTILGVKTDEYSVNIPGTTLPVVPFTATVDSQVMNFELVSVTSLNQEYIYELPPNTSSKFNMLYRNDKLGYGSSNTGFFCYFKQGNVQSYDFSLLQQISNQVVDIGSIENVNNTDTWLYQLDSLGNRTLWTKVDSVYTNNTVQTTSRSNARKIYSVLSGFNDRVSYTFGDGVFSEIPIGNFRAYVRTSNTLTYTIDPAEMQNVSVTFSYVSRTGRTETLTLTLQLQTTVSNAQARESLSDIKQRAPSNYYTQNRMVNGEDYNNFPYTKFNSIIKSKAVNRTSVGISRNLDLLDPTQKYSSSVSFANDGALYRDSTDTVQSLTITGLNSIVSYLTSNLVTMVANTRSRQYYLANYARYTIDDEPNGDVYWNMSTTDNGSVTGYFYTGNVSNKTSIKVGTYTTLKMMHCVSNALAQFSSPIIAGVQYYFDSNRRLTTTNTGVTTFWATVINVIGDGNNYGDGNFANGTGPVIISDYVPTEAKIIQIIPSFSGGLSTDVINQCVTKMQFNQNFVLKFDNSLLVTLPRWSVVDGTTSTDWFVKFELSSTNKYNVTYKSVAYYSGSVNDVRFYHETNKLVYDPRSAKVVKDYVSVIKNNVATKLTIVDQPLRSDGLVNDFEVEVTSTKVLSAINASGTTITDDPDFFTTLTGCLRGTENLTTASNLSKYVFFQLITDSIGRVYYTLVDSTKVIYSLATKLLITDAMYQYPAEQVFYAYSEDVFYQSVNQTQSDNVTNVYTLNTLTTYLRKFGGDNYGFQYRHNSNNTTRVDPGTTNIIDMYLVTQSYYTQYMNYVNDSTYTITEPSRPSINDLSVLYSTLDDYKMITDQVVLNSVQFKPLFGRRAKPELQATIKIVKNSLTTASDTEVRSKVLSTMNDYFSITVWDFGDTFYFSEMSAYIHSKLSDMISSVVLVPTSASTVFGDLFEVRCMPYEIFVNAATSSDIVIISSITQSQLR